MPGLTTYDEQELLTRIAGGDEAAFASIFKIYHPRLLGYIYKITGSQQIAEEVVQDVFMKIWTSRSQLGTIENFHGYLTVAARNHALNELEKAAAYFRHCRELARVQSGTAEQSPTAEPDFAREVVDRALHVLAPRQKQVWLLHKREGYSYDEIARMLGISKETVRSYLKESTKLVTKFLQNRESLLLLIALKLL